MNYLFNMLAYTNKFDGTSYAFLDPILKVLDEIVWPILIVVASIGTIYAIYLAVMLAKAEDANKREEAKKRIINAVIAIAVMVVLILFLKLFTTFGPQIIGYEQPEAAIQNVVDFVQVIKFM